MEVIVKARKIGGSIGVIIPSGIVARERIKEDDDLKIKVRKTSDLSFMWGKDSDVRESTDGIMKEIDEGEDE